MSENSGKAGQGNSSNAQAAKDAAKAKAAAEAAAKKKADDAAEVARAKKAAADKKKADEAAAKKKAEDAAKAKKAADDAAADKKKAETDAAEVARAKQAIADKKKSDDAKAAAEKPKGGPGSTVGTNDGIKPKPNVISIPEKPKAPTKPATPSKPRGGPGSTVGTNDGIKPKTPATPSGTGSNSGSNSGGNSGSGGKIGKPPVDKAPRVEKPKVDVPKKDTPKTDTPKTGTTTPGIGVPAYEIFKMQFRKYFTDIDKEAPWLNELYNSSKKYYEMGGVNPDDIPDLLLTDADAPPLYKARFAGIEKLKQRKATGVPVSHIPSVAEYTNMTDSMKKTFQKYGLNTMANDDNLANIIGNDVDAEEMRLRMDNAFAAIDNADEYLKKELATYYPNLGREDIALALLKGPEGSRELEKKVQSANITARAGEFGITSAVNAGNLYDRGYTAEDTRKGFATSAIEQKGLQNAATMFGDTGTGLTAEQQQGNITGVQTQRVEGLRSKARSEFQKQAGTSAGSLKRTRSGQV